MNYWIAPSLIASDKILEIKNKTVVYNVCRSYNIKVAQLVGRSRIKEIQEPRNITFYILHNKNKISYSEIGRMFNRTHATVLSAVKRISGFVEFDEDYKKQIDNIMI